MPEACAATAAAAASIASASPRNIAITLGGEDFAFDNGEQGDILVQKAPATTIKSLAQALINIFKSNSKIKVIGIRHGEKMHETLLTEEEMFNADDMGDYYRIPSDNRNLNYASYYTEGEQDISNKEDYNSHNTYQYDVEEMKSTLLKLDLIQNEL